MFDAVAKYSDVVGETHRKKFGQFFTESRVARFMIDWVLSGNTPSSLFDPAFGLGAFYDAAKSAGFRGTYCGAEIDQQVLSFFRKNSDSTLCQIDNADYLTIWNEVHSAIVCNPPYMRFQKIEGREEVHSNFASKLGIRLSGYTNIASAFLVKSISELAEGGRLAYIMPLEFLNAGYGKLVKSLLLEQGLLSAIIRIDCEKDAFPEATTSVGIILFEKVKSSAPVRFYVVNDLRQLDELLSNGAVSSVDSASLLPNEKWLRFFERSSQTLNADHLVSLSEYGGFSRGIATGANEFFSLNKEKITTLGLSDNEVVPCITKSAQIKKAIFGESDLANLVDANAPVFLLNLNGILSDSARKYIEQGEHLGLHSRYLTKARTPWYKIENRKPSPLLFGVFSRGGFKVIRNYSNALNLTCYHGFKPNIFGAEYVDFLFLYFQSAVGRYILSMNMRRYGDSLDKFEPNDLNNAPCPSIGFFEEINRDEVKSEIDYLNKFGKLSNRAESMFADLITPEITPSEMYKRAA